MDFGPLLKEEIEAGAEFLRQFNQYAPIKVAFWLKAPGDDVFRYLHVASDQIDETKIFVGYGVVNRIGAAMR